MWIQDLSNKEQTIDQIWEWHEEVTLSLKERLERITLAIKNKKFENIRESYSLMSIQEVSGRFQEIQSDMDNATCLALVAALDAALHVAIAKIITTDPAHAVTKALGSTQARIKRLLICQRSLTN